MRERKTAVGLGSGRSGMMRRFVGHSRESKRASVHASHLLSLSLVSVDSTSTVSFNPLIC